MTNIRHKLETLPTTITTTVGNTENEKDVAKIAVRNTIKCLRTKKTFC
jgi:hypothetical protein